MQRALLAEGQSVWCCKDCIGIIKEDKDATYKEIRDKAEVKAKPLPKDPCELADPLQSAEARAVAAEAEAKVAKAEAAAAKSHGGSYKKSEAAAESLPAVTGEVTSPSKVTSNQSSKSCAIV